MIDFWIFPLSTIWGAYHLQGFGAFFMFENLYAGVCELMVSESMTWQNKFMIFKF